MTNPLKAQIEILVDLQAIESHQFNIEKTLKKVPDQIQLLDNKVKKLEEEIEFEKKQVDDVKKEYRENEAKVRENLEKARKSDIKLMEVKNNKEYQSILKEIEEIKSKNAFIEDKMIECLDFLDHEEKRLKERKSEFEAIRKEIESEKKEIIEESEKEKNRYSALESQKQNVLKSIDEKILKQYGRVKGVVGRIAMARVENAMCYACNMSLPPQRFNELLRCEEIFYCPHCHRILYVEDKNDRSE